MMLKADGPTVRILWSMDCSEACVTAAVRTAETHNTDKARTTREQAFRKVNTHTHTELKVKVIKYTCINPLTQKSILLH